MMVAPPSGNSITNGLARAVKTARRQAGLDEIYRSAGAISGKEIEMVAKRVVSRAEADSLPTTTYTEIGLYRKERKKISERVISIPVTMYRRHWLKVQTLADEKHEGNRSGALREIVEAFKEEGKDDR